MMQPGVLQRVEGYMQTELARIGLTGAYAVLSGGETVLMGCHGEGITPDTRFEIGSITKSMTAAAILQLRDRGLLDLDDPVRRYLPWFRLKADRGEIRLRHLLNHTSGIPVVAQGVVSQDYDRIWPSVEAGVRALSAIAPASAPGAKFSYSNLGYATLGLVVEAVDGRPWARYVQEEILAPLSMEQSSADVYAAGLSLATPHRWLFGRPAPVGHRALGPYIAPAGSTTACTLREMGRYLAAQMGQIPFPGLAPASLAEAHSATCQMDDQHGYGLGWVVQKTEEKGMVIWHNGMTEGSSAIVMFLPDQEVGVVLMVNQAHGVVDALAAEVLRILCDKEPRPARQFGMFRAISLVFTAVAVVAAVLLVWLGLRIRADLAGQAATGSWPVWRALLLTAGAGGLWYVTVKLLPSGGEAPLWRWRLWSLDMRLGILGLLGSLSLWAIYSLAALGM